MKTIIRACGLFFVSILVGCANVQEPIALAPDAISKDDNIGVVMTALPKADTYFPGAGCLLCIAAASAANSSLTDYTHTLSSDDVAKIKTDVANVLKKKGVAGVTIIPDAISLETLPDNGSSGVNVSKKDYSKIAAKYGVDKLFVINITELGFERTYSAYFPTSDPKGVVGGAGYIVDAKNNTFGWYLPIKVEKSAELAWDEPPTFPGLTNAYYQSIELAKN